MVRIDQVYQTVLALADKERRGYITPQEFNLFARQAQVEIFEQYFYDLDRLQRMPAHHEEIGDKIEFLQEKINYHRRSTANTALPGNPTTSHANAVFQSSISTHVSDALNHNVFRILDVYHGHGNQIIERLSKSKFMRALAAPLTRPTEKHPICYIEGTGSTINPFVIAVAPFHEFVGIDYIRDPNTIQQAPNWTFLNVANNDGGNTTPTAIYNPTAIDHREFNLHSSEQGNLVTKILKLAGVAIKDFNTVQVASQEETLDIQQKR